ncbi:MAG: Arm DNA-binding domain-containing protein, partial [Terracidiphilus sp.]
MDATETGEEGSGRKERRLAPLTDKELQALGSTSNRYALRDGGGLFLDVTPGGVHTWIFRYQFNGKQEKFTIGRYPEIPLKVAREKRNSLAVKVANGESPAEAKRNLRTTVLVGTAGDPTVKEFGERYLKEQVDKNWKDPDNEHRYLEKDFFPEFGDRPLKNITVLDVQLVVYRKRDGGHPSAAIHLRN